MRAVCQHPWLAELLTVWTVALGVPYDRHPEPSHAERSHERLMFTLLDIGIYFFDSTVNRLTNIGTRWIVPGRRKHEVAALYRYSG